MGSMTSMAQNNGAASRSFLQDKGQSKDSDTAMGGVFGALGMKDSQRAFDHYAGKTGRDMVVTRDGMSKWFKDDMNHNLRRFEDSLTKGYVDNDSQSEGTSSPLRDQILGLRDGQERVLQGEWHRDIGRFNPWQIDRSETIGAVKLRSTGTIKATRRGDAVDIDGEVRHKVDNTYDFNDDTVVDQILFKPFRDRVDQGKAKPFDIKGLKTHKLGGRLFLDNGKIGGSDLFWAEDNE